MNRVSYKQGKNGVIGKKKAEDDVSSSSSSGEDSDSSNPPVYKEVEEVKQLQTQKT